MCQYEDYLRTREFINMSVTAGQVLCNRALQCSFSSVFHLRRAGMNANDASYIEHMFVLTVGLPIVLMGAAGLCQFLRKEGYMAVAGRGSVHSDIGK